MTSNPFYGITHRAPIVHTTSGDVYGRWQNASSAAYLGIPFAEPPVGALRFQAPKPHAAWDGVRPAVEYGPTPQRRPFGPAVTIPEPSIPGDSTLNVNVFTPAPRDTSAHLPVYVWIHGGGYFAGSPSSPWYNGREFNADGVVTVSISYRLGFQGFGWVDGAPLNRGLLDQIAALTWVQDNIEQFGGDPAKVTIGGQSAGGGSVLALLGSPKAQGLFRGVISESGAFNAVTVEQTEHIGRALAQAIGITPNLEAWSQIDENTILDHERDFNAIEEIPASASSIEELISIMKRGFISDSNLGYAPTVDGDVLTEAPRSAYRHGVGSDVALLAGTVRNEFSFPMPAAHTLADEEATLHAVGISDEAIARFSSKVHRIGEHLIGGQILTEHMFTLGLAHTALIRKEAGAGKRTWLYDFAQMSSVSNASMHCDEIPYVFNVLDEPKVREVLGDHPSQPLADAIHGRWVEFITNGRLDAPTVAEHDCGAIQFLGSERYDEHAYLFEKELVEYTMR